jgi:hypothetical protein
MICRALAQLKFDAQHQRKQRETKQNKYDIRGTWPFSTKLSGALAGGFNDGVNCVYQIIFFSIDTKTVL